MTVSTNCFNKIKINNDLNIDDLKMISRKGNFFQNIYKMLQVALILTVSFAICEWSSLAMWRIKTQVKTSMHK